MKTHILKYSLLILLFNMSCASPSVQQPISERLTADFFEQKIKDLKSPLILDVRTPEEFERGHNEPLVMKQLLESLDPNQPILVYCAAGGRSSKTIELMLELGFNEVYELTKGINGWEAAGKPITKD
jgi:rhodanese-related sulfurtransferase